ncbi:MAG: shikimate kinase [Ferruginibacter sp.]
MTDLLKKPGVNFFLIGFMGSGKTHWGKIWALKNQLEFLDLDHLVEEKEGKTIAEIFETSGEDHFRKIEAAALKSCAGLQNTIIACGGGTPCFFDNMQWMNANGTTTYIDCTPAEILQRILPEKDQRPLLKKLNESELFSFIEKKLEERVPVYTQAKITVMSDELTENSFAGIISPIIA